MHISLKHLSPRHTAALLAAPLLFAGNAPGEDYRFLVSGYPAANASRSAASAGIALETGSLHAAAANVDPQEWRYRTSAASEGSALRSDAPQGFMLIVR